MSDRASGQPRGPGRGPGRPGSPPGNTPARPQAEGRYDYYRQQQPRAQSGGGGGQPPRRPGSGGRPKPARPKRWGRRVLIALGLIVALLLAFFIYLDTTLQRGPALADYPGRPGDTKGTNWLLVGSDSREGLDEQQKQDLATGNVDDAGGRRTDTMMLLHISESGHSTLVSLPRDSYVPIPGHGRDKLNAAFGIGGPKLLIQTVESVTGVHMDHYAEIGFAGFADLTDSVGGVDVCVKEPMNDPLAGLNLQPGCQELNGRQALGYVRTRASPRGDLDRVERQREFLGALVGKANSPATYLNPFRLFPLATSAPKAFMVDDGDHLWHLYSMARAMGEVSSGKGTATTVPFGGFGETDEGSSVILWDKENASTMFDAIAKDQPIPPEVITK